MVLDGVKRLRKQRFSEILIRYPRVAPIAAFALAMLGTLFVAMSIERTSRVEQRVAVREGIGALGQDLERRAAATQAYLISGAALFESGIEVNQATFDRFAATLQGDKDFRGIQALGWSMRLRPDQVVSFERAVRASGVPDFRSWPTPPPGDQWVDAIRYVAPLSQSNRKILGFNMHTDPGRRGAIDQTTATGKPAITGMVKFVTFGADPAEHGFFMFAPVFTGSEGSPSARVMKGYIYGKVRADDFIMASVQHQAVSKLDIQIYDTVGAQPQLLFQKGRAIADRQAVTRRIQIADHEWIIKSSAAPLNVLSQTGMLILLAGLIIASLLLFIVRLAIQQALFDRQQLRVRQEQDAIRATLTRELNHRVKNTLANVLSILSLSRRGATDLDSFVEIFEGRVRALSATHNLLMQTSWGPTSIVEVIHTEMAPYFGTGRPRLALDGPDAVIAPNDALSLGLLLHELMTNAAKYGALSNDTGTVTLNWTPTGAPADGQQILFTWREEGGPPLPAERKRGFGSDLIEKVISRELRSDIKLEFAETGVRCTFEVPVRAVCAFSLKQDG